MPEYACLSSRTDHRLAIDKFKEALSVPDKEGQVEKIFHRLTEVIRVYNEAEEIDLAALPENCLNLQR